MNRSRFFRALLGGVCALCLLVLLAHSIVPGRASAVYTPPDISKEIIPGDPGTPYEEPENDPTGPIDPKPPEGISGGSGAPVATPGEFGPPTRRAVDRRWLLLCLPAWEFQLHALLRF